MAIEPDQRYRLDLPTFLPRMPEEHQANLRELERWGNTLPLNPRTSVAYYGTTTGEQPPWNLPWGQVAAPGASTANQATITAAVDLTGLTVTFNALAGRQYAFWATGEYLPTVADGAFVLALTDGSGTQVKRATGPCLTTAASESVHLFHSESYSTGTITRKLRLSKATGTGSLTWVSSSNNPGLLVVKDIGPVFGTAAPSI